VELCEIPLLTENKYQSKSTIGDFRTCQIICQTSRCLQCRVYNDSGGPNFYENLWIEKKHESLEEKHLIDQQRHQNLEPQSATQKAYTHLHKKSPRIIAKNDIEKLP
jgi:hypothetical protein